MNHTTLCLFFVFCFFSLNTMPVRLTHVLCHSNFFFLLLSSVLLCECLITYLFSFPWLFEQFLVFDVRTKLQWIFLYMPFDRHVYIILLGINLRFGMNKLRYIIYFTLINTVRQFSKVVFKVYTSTSSVWAFWLLYIQVNI